MYGLRDYFPVELEDLFLCQVPFPRHALISLCYQCKRLHPYHPKLRRNGETHHRKDQAGWSYQSHQTFPRAGLR